MDIEKLAETAMTVFDNMPCDLYSEHGMEVAPGFFVVYNYISGQSRLVIYHPESDYIFKSSDYNDAVYNSGESLGTVELDGEVYRIRFPKCRFFEFDGGSVEVQEFVHGRPDPCLEGAEGFTNSWCEHAYAIAGATDLGDTHTGNWKIVGDEIIVFDC